MMALIPLVAERILNSLPLGLLVVVLAGMVLRVSGQQNSRTRFAVWFSALLGIVALSLFHHHHVAMLDAVRPAEITLPSSWAIAIASAWAVLFLLATFRILVGLWKIRVLRRSSLPLKLNDADLVLRQTISEIQSQSKVSVHISEAQPVPAAIGFLKPVILIPGWAIRELPTEELRAILLHEFAHIQRRDAWTNLIQKLIKAALFFHPAVWWIDKRLSLEREMACDDVVLSTMADPRGYAACLVSLAEKRFLQRSLMLVQAAVSRVCETSIRVAEILRGGRRNQATCGTALISFGAVAVALVAVLPEAPELVTFQQPVKSIQRTSAMQATPLKYVPATLPASKPAIVPAALKTSATPHRAARARKSAALCPQLPVTTPKAILASARPPQQPEQMFVVVKTAQYDGRGRALFTLTVWRVSVNPPGVSDQQNGVAPKSI